MKTFLFLLSLALLLHSCGNASNSEVEELKAKNHQLQNTIDSIKNNLDHSLVIYEDDIRTHFGTITKHDDEVDSNSDFYFSTQMIVNKLPDNFKVKWKIDQEGAEILDSSNLYWSVKFPKLKPGDHTFTGTYEIYLNDRMIHDNSWYSSVYVKK